MSKAKVSWFLCIGRLVSKTDNVMHFARLVKQPSVDLVSDWFVFGAYTMNDLFKELNCLKKCTMKHKCELSKTTNGELELTWDL